MGVLLEPCPAATALGFTADGQSVPRFSSSRKAASKTRSEGGHSHINTDTNTGAEAEYLAETHAAIRKRQPHGASLAVLEIAVEGEDGFFKEPPAQIGQGDGQAVGNW